MTIPGRDRARGRVIQRPLPDPDEDDDRHITGMTLEEIALSIGETYTGSQLPRYLRESGVPEEFIPEFSGSKWEYVLGILEALHDGGSSARRVLREFIGGWLDGHYHTPPRPEVRKRIAALLTAQGWHVNDGRLVIGERTADVVGALTPLGQDAQITALHADVREVADRFLESGHSEVAIFEAFKAVNNRVKAMTGRELDGSALMGEAFKDSDPRPDPRRLRISAPATPQGWTAGARLRYRCARVLETREPPPEEPKMRRLVVAVIASGWALAGASSAQAAPRVTLSPAVGPPTTSVKVTGTGFQSTTSADVFFDTTDVAIATSNASGSITSTITVPANAQPGNHWITIDERHGALAAQASFVVRTDWPQQGFGAQGRRYNAYENTISPNNVSRLTLAWSAFASQLGNATPFVEYQSNLFVGEINGVVRAYKPTGGLLWTASPGGDLEFVTPAAYNQRVYFGSDNGMVRAYLAVCRADGGVCKPLWSKSVGTAVTGPLTVANGTLYAPSADGTVHALNPTTGAPATPLATLGGSGPVTTGAAFGADGSYVYGRGSTFDYRLPCCSGTSAEGGTVSSAAIATGAPYFTTSDGLAHQFLSSGWTASIPGAGCNWAPAAANNVIYAASCGTLAALDAGTGAVQWSLSTPAYYNPVVANDVLYTCISTGFNAVVVAFDARYGGRLWTGRYCSTQPIVANGVLYVAGNGQLDAYDLQSAVAARRARRASNRPDPRKLRIDPRLHRHHKR